MKLRKKSTHPQPRYAATVASTHPQETIERIVKETLFSEA
jgi:hypothetical protein